MTFRYRDSRGRFRRSPDRIWADAVQIALLLFIFAVVFAAGYTAHPFIAGAIR